ncbi:unnamed protein product [Calicophoron daubneyi]|uniref:Uncharacterized protein n=1 Tax=Calicophoron daubneyi TaxID=300641 RepID=A0AAV2TDW4_CALDB
MFRPVLNHGVKLFPVSSRLFIQRPLATQSCAKTPVEKPLHIPVMRDEVVRQLDPKPGQVLLDMTFGAGGHTKALLDAVPDLTCYALDRDREALQNVERLRTELDRPSNAMIPLLGKFSDLPKLCEDNGLVPNSVDLIVMDLGMSSMQLDSPARGFGIRADGPLDMRMDRDCPSAPTAAEVVNTLDPPDLAHIFKTYGEERFARRIANAIFEHRHVIGPISTTKMLADIVSSVVPGWSRANRDSQQSTTHPATRVFQALRIFVNDEINELCAGLELAYLLLRSPGGRLAVISFHSLEDRLVKWALLASAEECDAGLASYLVHRTLTSEDGLRRRQALLHQLDTTEIAARSALWRSIAGPIQPSEAEIISNPRCRSAKLRTGEKC